MNKRPVTPEIPKKTKEMSAVLTLVFLFNDIMRRAIPIAPTTKPRTM
ncbi:hypothetical protein [Sulfuracidifex metallicus]|nr:hypothetical protein [Sulfuracidifex metallicus]